MKKHPKLFVFDLGETLINYKGVSLNWSTFYNDALRLASKACNITYNENTLAEARQILLEYNTRINPRIEEVSADVIFSKIISLFKIPGTSLKLFIEKFFEYFQREAEPENTALELLLYLKQNNINTAVLTDVPYGMPKYLVEKDLGVLKQYIDLLVTSVDIGFRKPSPQGLEFILNHFGVKSGETIFVGNEKKDIETAKEMDVYSVLLNRESDPPEWGQDRTISKLIDIKNYFV
jgi:putative hydrolase of the HAD superfamily